MKKSIIYTKTGDKGKTSLVGGTRVDKTHIRLEAYGTIDELNSFIGWMMTSMSNEENLRFLQYVQHKLFTVGSYLATETEAMPPKAASIITEEDIKKIESEIDHLDAELPQLRQFILPGGSESGSRAHICRTVCRRAERRMYDVRTQFPVEDNVMKFVNRLSDYLFVLSRTESIKNGKEIFWDQSRI